MTSDTGGWDAIFLLAVPRTAVIFLPHWTNILAVR
jgi:hypothetical protein